uniref:SWIM-type domain-containing protein n=1 Tax=Meloidogyne floridensis TaxID=298350 RepID=A0A915P9I3_9BILA
MDDQQPHDDENVMEEEDTLVLRMEAMMLAEDQEDRLSFADSERFDEDDEQYSVQASDSSSISHHWRGWDSSLTKVGQGFVTKPFLIADSSALDAANFMEDIPSLKDLAAKRVASSISFELIEATYSQLPTAQKRLRPQLPKEKCQKENIGHNGQEQHLQDYLPEQLVLLILRHCFPESSENIRLYSCLTNCGDRLFALGENLFKNGAVSKLFQIGCHLSAKVQERFGLNNTGSGLSGESISKLFISKEASENNVKTFDVCILVDRCRIVSCACSCSNTSFWCQHAVAACLQRIQQPNTVQYRPAIWDSITSLRDLQVKKMVQCLINKLPREYIPVAQELIDALKDNNSLINQIQGAPDPTVSGLKNIKNIFGLSLQAGPTDDTPAVWCMDEKALHEEVRKTLINFMRPSAMPNHTTFITNKFFSEVQSLLSSPPALAYEWSILYRTLCAKQPESIWNLLGMVRVMLTRNDANGPALLHILTEECLALDSVLIRWYQISLSASGHWYLIGPNGGTSGQRANGNAQQSQSRQLFSLWRLIALNPRLTFEEREQLWVLLQLYQRTSVMRIWTILGKATSTENYTFGTAMDGRGNRLCQQNAPFGRNFFPAFFPALRACKQFSWTRSEAHRLLREMNVCPRLSTDIQIAQKQHGRFPTLPFLRDADNGITLIDLVEMERQLGNASIAYNPDAVLVPSSKSSKRRKKHKKAQQRQKMQKLGINNENTNRKRRERQQPSEQDVKEDPKDNQEQVSEISSDEENQKPECSKCDPLKREQYEDALDRLFAEAHADFDDPFTLRFMYCEALFAHGYFNESLQFANILSANLINNQPNLLLPIGVTDLQIIKSNEDETAERKSNDKLIAKPFSSVPHSIRQSHFRRQFSSDSIRRVETNEIYNNSTLARLSRAHPRLMANSTNAKDTLTKTIFLVKLLMLGEEFFDRKMKRFSRQHIATTQKADNSKETSESANCSVQGEYRLLALELCLATMRNLRGPSATRLLEMEINQLEGDLFTLLHRIEICPNGLKIVRFLAQQLLKNLAVESLPTNVTVPPTRLAHYIVNVLSSPYSPYQQQHVRNAAQLSDVHISERDHPLLCECIRRHRKDLQMVLFTRNRDSPERLPRVLTTVLDEKVHRIYDSIQSSSSATSTATSPSSSPFDFGIGQQQVSGDRFFPSTRSSISKPFPMLANQASEAQAHHMFEFAKSLLLEAGGNQSSPMFNPVQAMATAALGAAAFLGGAGAPQIGPHRNLHICSLLIALYALGLNNECSPSWNTRTYSTHVSWIQAQALDIGRQALEIIRRTWHKHLTPTEVASLADKASQSSDLSVVEEAAQLALSVLPEANSLLPAESLKALNQCKERSPRMLEDACLAIEKSTQRGGVYPEVLFRVSHHWYNLYVAHLAELEGSVIGEPPSSSVSLNNNKSTQKNNLNFFPHQQQYYLHHQSPPQIPFFHSLQTTDIKNTFVGSTQQPVTSASTWQPVVTQHQQTLQFCIVPPTAPPLYLMPPHLPPPPFYSPSIPPPPLPQVAAPAAILANDSSTSSTNNNSNTLFRLHPSFSVPNMTGEIQQQPNNILPTSAWFQVPLQQQIAQPQPGTSAVHAVDYAPSMNQSIQQNFVPTGLNLRMLPSIHHHANQHQFASSAGAVTMIQNQLQQQQIVAIQQFNQQQQNRGFHQLNSQHRFPPPPTTMTTGRLVVLDDRALYLIRNAHRLGIMAMNNLRSSDSLSAKFAKNPPSCDDVCWLLDVSIEIGDPEYVRMFCEKVIASISSPFVLIELFKSVLKFFHQLPNSHRIPGTGQIEAILLSSNGDLAKLCMQQARNAMTQISMSGIAVELALHAISSAFSAASHKLNFNNFNAPDQEYVCDLALITRELFRLLPPTSHHDQQQPQGRRKYMDIFMEHMQKQKCFRKFKNVQTAIQNALQQQHQQQRLASQQQVVVDDQQQHQLRIRGGNGQQHFHSHLPPNNNS